MDSFSDLKRLNLKDRQLFDLELLMVGGFAPLGEHAYKIPINSTKSMTGHLLGAAGSIEVIAVIKSIETQIVHPTTNLDNPDPECDLDYVANVKRNCKVENAISNSFGFGGHNVTITVGKFNGTA